MLLLPLPLMSDQMLVRPSQNSADSRNKIAYAGAALSMPNKIGQLHAWDQWACTSKICGWLLLAGDCDPPDSVYVSSRRAKSMAKDGAFLSGISHDFSSMEKCIWSNGKLRLVQKFQKLRVTKSEFSQELRYLAEVCAKKDWKPCVYYTGHGEEGTGDWCLKDGTMTFEDVIACFSSGSKAPIIFTDCCYSGNWANMARGKNLPGLFVLSACSEYEVATDHTNLGGSMTLWTTGQRMFPATCPLWSGEAYSSYKTPAGYNEIDYVDFVAAMIRGHRNTGQIVTMQNVSHDGRLTIQFGKDSNFLPRPATQWGVRYGSEDLTSFIKEMWDDKKRVVHLSACGQRFFLYGMNRYGTEQSWFGRATLAELNKEILKNWKYGKRITSCCATDDLVYVVMTKDAPSFEASKVQKWALKDDWLSTSDFIGEGYKNGRILTSLAYLRNTKQYWAVLTDSSAGQSYTWDCNEQWETEHKGKVLKFEFKDPSDNKTLRVRTSAANLSCTSEYDSWKLK